MTKNYDSGIDTTTTPANGVPNQRTIEFATVSNAYVWIYINTSNNLVYAFGNGTSWTTETLTGVGNRLNLNVTVTSAALAIDQNNDNVHIAFRSNTNVLYHCECIVPTVPNDNASWTSWSGNRYQQVDNSTGSTIGTMSIAVDSVAAGKNGDDDPHIVWEENNGGTYEIHYNYGNGTDHAFTPASEITLKSGGRDPAIVVIKPDGRDIYVCWKATAAVNIECGRCLENASPLNVANWGGPLVGPGMGWDVVLTGTTALSNPSMSWWWDQFEHVGVAAYNSGGTNVKTRMWDQSAPTPAWTSEYTAAGYTGTAAEAFLANVDSNKWRLFVRNTSSDTYHAVKGSIDFSSGATWYQLATTQQAIQTISVEWRGQEFGDERSGAAWKDASDNEWFSLVRKNRTPEVDRVDPGEGVYRNELVNINIDWDFVDVDNDIQREYSLEVDDDSGFGTPIVQTGWTATVATVYQITASTLSADTTYYWRIKVRDSEYGTEYDTKSESAWYPTSGTWSFKTTPQCTIDIISVAQQYDKDVYITIKLRSEVDETLDLITHTYDDGGGATTMTIIDGESTDAHNDIDVEGGVNLYYVLAWDADAQLASDFDDDVDVSFSVQYASDSHGLGSTSDSSNNHPIDYKKPTQAIGAPNGTVVTVKRPTLSGSFSDTNNYTVHFQISKEADFDPLFDYTTDWLSIGVNSWQITKDLDQAGTWYFRTRARDNSPSLNANATWEEGSFTYTPPPDPVTCRDETMTLEIDNTRSWTGDEYDVLDFDDVTGSITLELARNRAPRLSFRLNNYNGKYANPSSDYYIRQGDEVRFTRGNISFYGTVQSIETITDAARVVEVECAGFTEEASSFPIQLRVVPTASSGLYWEDYIKIGLTSSGLVPRWFKFVDGDGNEIYRESESVKTQVLGASDVVYDKVQLVDFLNDISQRTGKVWYEGWARPVGRKAYLYWTDPADIEGTADHTFFMDTNILKANLTYDKDGIVNRVVFSDADVIEQDMTSIRDYGVRTIIINSVGAEDSERLVEIAQYILSERAQPRLTGSIPLTDEPFVTPNQLVRIYEVSSDDVKSGFSGNYAVVGVRYDIGDDVITQVTISSFWENPIINMLQELLRNQSTSSSDDAITILRVETAEAKLYCPEYGVGVDTTTDTYARVGIDHYSDLDTDSDYYSTLGGPS